MVNFDKILIEEYNHEHVLVKEFLVKHEMDGIIQRAISHSNSVIKNLKTTKEIKRTLLTSLASALVVKVNEHLRLVRKSRKKDFEKLELILGNIFRIYLQNVVTQLNKAERKLFSKELYLSFEQICNVHEYDFNKLLESLGVPEQVGIQSAKLNDQNALLPDKRNHTYLPSFMWKFKSSQEDFFQIIDGLKITDELDKFKLLFSKPKENLNIVLNAAKRDFILQLFGYLNTRRFLTYRSCGGFYQVLSCHVRDFDRTFLRGDEAFRAIERAKDLKTWPDTENELEELFRPLSKKPDK